MRVEPAKQGDVYLDSYPFSLGGTYEIAQRWKAQGVAGFVGYLGVMSAQRLDYIHRAGLSFMAVTRAAEYRNGPADEIAQLKALAIPKGSTVWVDVEGRSALVQHAADYALLQQWSLGIAADQHMPGGYFGSPQPYTSEELYELPVQRYWHGQGFIRDRFDKPAEPFKSWDGTRYRMWNMIQAAPSRVFGGCLVDFNMVYGDGRNGFPMVVAP